MDFKVGDLVICIDNDPVRNGRWTLPNNFRPYKIRDFGNVNNKADLYFEGIYNITGCAAYRFIKVENVTLIEKLIYNIQEEI